MIEQLQDQIGRLMTESSIKQSEFVKKRQQYEQIIQDLQNQNERLRKKIEENIQSLSSSFIQSQIKSSKTQKNSEYSANIIKNNVNAVWQHHQIQQKIDQLSSENNYLRKELHELADSYEKQIDQMKDYFVKIKQAFLQRPYKQSIDSQNNQLAGLLKAYESLLSDFQSQKNKYISKIEELTTYLIEYYQRQKQCQQNGRRLQLDLQIARQQLRIYKRSRMVKL